MTLNIVVPMAGAGSRFAVAGFTDPKPLIPVHGVPMIRLVIANLAPSRDHRFVFVCQREHVERYELQARLQQWSPGSIVIPIDGLTRGAAETVLHAAEHIDEDAPLMIANSDQWVDVSIDEYLDDMDERSLDGLIMTMEADDPKWSYAVVDGEGRVLRVVEKQVVSHHATVGIYNFARGADFVAAARQMIAADDRVNGEFYVAPVYDRIIAGGAAVGVHDVGREADGMYGLGIPDDLRLFESLPISMHAARTAHR